ncbi:unnamed protein product [Rotaria magnacalcarata]|uniref:Uncharacterized protein n=3 Tax=Rotaria magnacalcarata TaxID=392030 RepID=A0A8S2L8N4_9BILA|nr:unnamed protein product [Rotaria magnacalcarata]
MNPKISTPTLLQCLLEDIWQNPNAVNNIIPADLWLSQNVQNNECYVEIRWNAKEKHIYLAIMQISLSKLNDLNQYRWRKQNNQINLLRNKFHNKTGILVKLDIALSYIKEDALYIPPPVSVLITLFLEHFRQFNDIFQAV